MSHSTFSGKRSHGQANVQVQNLGGSLRDCFEPKQLDRGAGTEWQYDAQQAGQGVREWRADATLPCASVQPGRAGSAALHEGYAAEDTRRLSPIPREVRYMPFTRPAGVQV